MKAAMNVLAAAAIGISGVANADEHYTQARTTDAATVIIDFDGVSLSPKWTAFMLVMVDGQMVTDETYNTTNNYFMSQQVKNNMQDVETAVAPGKRTIVVATRFNRGSAKYYFDAIAALEVDAVKGHTYQPQLEIDNDHLIMWMEDKQTKEVASNKARVAYRISPLRNLY